MDAVCLHTDLADYLHTLMCVKRLAVFEFVQFHVSSVNS
jgi:hypothetical protein